MSFDTIKKNYDRKLWSLQAVAWAVEAKLITAEQYTEITGEKYKK